HIGCWTILDQPVSVVGICSAIYQTEAAMVLRILNFMRLKINLMVVLNVVEETDPNDLPLDQAVSNSLLKPLA
ncbi:hypothetical protein A2U01_0100912, partial [Trifolium medium]|nr:hypothetical protein [Trifolium medium]